jgi:hypothetical protein
LHDFRIGSGLRLVLQKSHHIFDYDLIFKANQLNNTFCNPWLHDVEVDFPHVDLLFKLGWKLGGFNKLPLFVREAPILLAGSALEE